MPLIPKAEDILGMSTEDFKKKLEGSVFKEDLDALKTQMGTEFSSLAEGLKAELAKLTSKPPEPPPVTDDGDPTTDLLTDPDAFLSKRNQPLVNATLETRAEVQEM